MLLTALRVRLISRYINKQVLAIEQFCLRFKLLLVDDVQSKLQGYVHNTHGYDLLLKNQEFKQLIQKADLIW